MVRLVHGDGFATLYGHLSEVRVGLGQAVEAGEVIGTAGSTGRASGSHLHFEVLRYGRPVDPEGFVRFR
jgi:murein DD-endopeptidase MepM/ murein hydrolase activator NlpD